MLSQQARADGAEIDRRGGLPGRLTKMVVEGTLGGEMDDHPGYAKCDPTVRDGNSRNGYGAKTMFAEARPVEISVPGIGIRAVNRRQRAAAAH
jgi:transposase-like protein